MPSITFNWLTDDDLEAIGPVWRELQNRCDPSIFQTFEWASIWWERYKRSGDHLLIGVLKEGGRVQALLPLFVRSRLTICGPLRVGQFLGIEEVAPSSMDVLATRKGTELLAKDFSNLIQKWQTYAELLDLAPVRASSKLFNLLNEIPKSKQAVFQSEVEKAPVLPAPGSFARWMEELGSSTRRDIRRKRSHLAAKANIKIARYDQADDVERGLKKLADLNIKRLTQLGKHGGFMLPRFLEFHLKYCNVLAEQKKVHLFELTHGEQVISAALVYTLGDTWYAYQTGMDPEYLHFAPGAVLDSYVLEFIFDKTDAAYVDMGLGHQDYKLRFGGIPQDAYRLRLPANSWRGHFPKIGLLVKESSLRFAKAHKTQVEQPCN